MADLIEQPLLRKYLANVRDWHGYVRFLGLPDRRDNRDILIDRLFVEPLVTRQYVSPDLDSSSWNYQAETIFDVLQLGKPVVLLGDPGSGKSTLLNYLVWLLARPTGDVWTKRMGFDWLLPVPMVLRELQLRNVSSFGGLLAAFLNHAMSEPLRDNDYLNQMLSEGRALVLLDGIDELGSPEARANLRRAVFDGFSLYPGCRWLLSSRIVGYDEAPFDAQFDEGLVATETRAEAMKDALNADRENLPAAQTSSLHAKVASRGTDTTVVTRYMAPFDDQRIDTFASNWYAQRESAVARADEEAAHFVRAVQADAAILRLARVPNLLTMMALIHRLEATLPHGRALLYERIAEAYLESIDRYRGVYSGAYGLPHKKRWLARVGYELQQRRTNEGEQEDEHAESELLANAASVVVWLEEEMQKGGGASVEMSAREFLDFVGRRSGLFLPRGNERYAFVHLSFQEYFAAVALEREVTGLDWARNRPTSLKLTRSQLAKRAEQSTWCETFAFLFELLASKEDWHADLLDALFGEDFCLLITDPHASSTANQAKLLARLVNNPQSGLTHEKRKHAVSTIVNTVVVHGPGQVYWKPAPSALKELLGENTDQDTRILEEIVEKARRRSALELTVAETGISDIAPLANLIALTSLNLSRTQITDIRPLGSLVNLKQLRLGRTHISDIAPLADLRALEWLELEKTPISNLSPLADLTALELLDLGGTQVSDLRPLAGLATIDRLYLENTSVSDLGPLTGLKKLKSLLAWDTKITDLKPLAQLTNLTTLHLSNTQVADIGSLAGHLMLKTLSLWSTQVSDLKPLAQLTALEYLDLAFTQVSNLGPLAGLAALKVLDLQRTNVSDLRPLTNLTALEKLDLSHTRVSNLEPLAGLATLTALDLQHTNVSDPKPLAELTALENLDLSHTRVSNLEPLAGLATLTALDLQHTNVSDPKPLAELTALENLDLSHTRVSNLEPLIGNKTLQSLNLRGAAASGHAVVELRGQLPKCKIYA